jgi:hypothetical protein
MERAQKDLVPEVAKRLAPKIDELNQQQYASGTDPYGAKWAAKKDGSASFLTASGAMKSSATVVPGVDKIVGKTLSPAPFHQSGTKNMPARPIYPDRGIPVLWRDAVNMTVAETIRDRLVS